MSLQYLKNALAKGSAKEAALYFLISPQAQIRLPVYSMEYP